MNKKGLGYGPKEVLQDITDSQLFAITRRTDQGSDFIELTLKNLAGEQDRKYR